MNSTETGKTEASPDRVGAKVPKGRPPTHGPRRNMTMAFPTDLIDRLDALSGELAMTRTEMIVLATQRFLEEKERQSGAEEQA